MWLFNLVGGIVCGAASIPVRIAGDVMEGIGILTGIDVVADVGNAVADFSDELQGVAEDALERMTENQDNEDVRGDEPESEDNIDNETQEDNSSKDG